MRSGPRFCVLFNGREVVRGVAGLRCENIVLGWYRDRAAAVAAAADLVGCLSPWGDLVDSASVWDHCDDGGCRQVWTSPLYVEIGGTK